MTTCVITVDGFTGQIQLSWRPVRWLYELQIILKKITLSIRVTLTHWGRVTHICVSKLTIIGSDNGLSPGRRQAIIWTNAGILLIQTLGTKFSEILREIYTFSSKKMHLKMSGKCRPTCLGLNVLTSGYWCNSPLVSSTDTWCCRGDVFRSGMPWWAVIFHPDFGSVTHGCANWW